MTTVKNHIVNLDGYRAHPQNYNKHSDTQLSKLMASLSKFGQIRSIVVWREYIIAGHGLTEAAKRLGWKSLRADVLDSGISQEVALAYLVADNELARQSDPDQAALAAILDQVKQADAELVTAAGFSEQELAELLKSLEPASEPVDAPAQIDRAEELQAVWNVQPGDVWQIGEHRLMCGDCTDKATVDRLMGGEKAQAVVTDSPYGINREGIENDDPEGLRTLFDGCLAAMPVENAVIINFQSPRLFPVWLDALRSAGHKFERMLWMYDENDQTKPWHYWLMCSQAICISSIGKPMWSDCKAHHDTYTIGLNREWRAGGVENDFSHASVKPAGVVQDIMAHTVGITYDPFAGSGTTGIACENLKRKARMIEISPAYCSVILQRMKDATGLTGVRVEA